LTCLPPRFDNSGYRPVRGGTGRGRRGREGKGRGGEREEGEKGGEREGRGKGPIPPTKKILAPPLNSYTLQCGIWLWDHDSEFTKWQ